MWERDEVEGTALLVFKNTEGNILGKITRIEDGLRIEAGGDAIDYHITDSLCLHTQMLKAVRRADTLIKKKYPLEGCGWEYVADWMLTSGFCCACIPDKLPKHMQEELENWFLLQEIQATQGN